MPITEGFEFRGIFYDNLSSAAKAYGIAPTYLYNTKKKKNISSPEAMEYVVKSTENRNNTESTYVGRSKPCIVLGIKYKSRKEAAERLGVPYVTVTSKVQRSCNNMTFEEVLEGLVLKKPKNSSADDDNKKYDMHPMDSYTKKNFISCNKELIAKLEIRNFIMKYYSYNKENIPTIMVEKETSQGFIARYWIIIDLRKITIFVTDFTVKYPANQRIELLDKIYNLNHFYGDISLGLFRSDNYKTHEVYATAPHIFASKKNADLVLETLNSCIISINGISIFL